MVQSTNHKFVRGACRRRTRLLTVACVLRPGPWRIGTMPDAPEGKEYSSLHTKPTPQARVARDRTVTWRLHTDTLVWRERRTPERPARMEMEDPTREEMRWKVHHKRDMIPTPCYTVRHSTSDEMDFAKRCVRWSADGLTPGTRTTFDKKQKLTNSYHTGKHCYDDNSSNSSCRSHRRRQLHEQFNHSRIFGDAPRQVLEQDASVGGAPRVRPATVVG